MDNDLKKLVNENEKILYEGRPNKKCFIFESIFNPLLPFAIIWAVIDIGFFGRAMLASEEVSLLSFVIPFMLLHMMPVWIYLGGVLFTARKYKNTYYIVTDSGIYVSGKGYDDALIAGAEHASNFSNYLSKEKKTCQITYFEPYKGKSFETDGDIGIYYNSEVYSVQKAFKITLYGSIWKYQGSSLLDYIDGDY